MNEYNKWDNSSCGNGLKNGLKTLMQLYLCQKLKPLDIMTETNRSTGTESVVEVLLKYVCIVPEKKAKVFSKPLILLWFHFRGVFSWQNRRIRCVIRLPYT